MVNLVKKDETNNKQPQGLNGGEAERAVRPWYQRVPGLRNFFKDRAQAATSEPPTPDPVQDLPSPIFNLTPSDEGLATAIIDPEQRGLQGTVTQEYQELLFSDIYNIQPPAYGSIYPIS